MTTENTAEVDYCVCLMPLGSKTCHHCKKPVKPATNNTEARHVLLTPQTCPCDKQDDRLCSVCDGGLAICSICNKAEVELSEPCVFPKSPIAEELHGVQTQDSSVDETNPSLSNRAGTLRAAQGDGVAGDRVAWLFVQKLARQAIDEPAEAARNLATIEATARDGADEIVQLRAERDSVREIFEWFTRKLNVIKLDGQTPQDVMTAFNEIVQTCKRAKGMARLAKLAGTQDTKSSASLALSNDPPASSLPHESESSESSSSSSPAEFRAMLAEADTEISKLRQVLGWIVDAADAAYIEDENNERIHEIFNIVAKACGIKRRLPDENHPFEL